MTKRIRIVLFFLKNSIRFSRKQLRKPETIISFGGFALSVAILTASLTLLNGYQRTLKESLLGVNAHLFLYNPTAERLTENDVSNISDFLHTQDEVESFSPVIMTQVMAHGSGQVKGVLARSIRWQDEILPTNYHRYISQGSGELKSRNDAVIGSELANYLNVTNGDLINLVSPANMEYTIFGLKTGEISIDIVGIYHSGIYDTDSRTIFLNEGIFSELTGDSIRYDLIEIKLQPEHLDRADYISYLWNNMLEHEYLINSWIDYNSNLFTMLVLQKWVIGIILSFLILIASFNIISNTTTSILERRREIGILKATGCSNNILRYFFVGKTFVLSMLAIIAGIGGGLLLAYLLTKQTFLMLKGDVYFIEHFTVRPDLSSMIIILFISLIIALWATITALKRLSKLTIIESIRSS